MYTKFEVVVILLILIRCSYGNEIEFENCGRFVLDNLQIENCGDVEGDEICRFHAGKTYNVSFNIFPDNQVNTITARACLYQWGASFYMPITPEDTCKALQCPIIASSNRYYQGTFIVPDTFVPYVYDLLITMTDDEMENVVCMKKSNVEVYR